jgi:hypothetical protein
MSWFCVNMLLSRRPSYAAVYRKDVNSAPSCRGRSESSLDGTGVSRTTRPCTRGNNLTDECRLIGDGTGDEGSALDGVDTQSLAGKVSRSRGGAWRERASHSTSFESKFSCEFIAPPIQDTDKVGRQVQGSGASIWAFCVENGAFVQNGNRSTIAATFERQAAEAYAEHMTMA